MNDLQSWFARTETRLGAPIPDALKAHYHLLEEDGPLDSDHVECEPLLTPESIDEQLDLLEELHAECGILEGLPALLPVLPKNGRNLHLLVLEEGWEHPVGMVVSFWTDSLESEDMVPLEELLDMD